MCTLNPGFEIVHPDRANSVALKLIQTLPLLENLLFVAKTGVDF